MWSASESNRPRQACKARLRTSAHPIETATRIERAPCRVRGGRTTFSASLACEPAAGVEPAPYALTRRAQAHTRSTGNVLPRQGDALPVALQPHGAFAGTRTPASRLPSARSHLVSFEGTYRERDSNPQIPGLSWAPLPLGHRGMDRAAPLAIGARWLPDAAASCSPLAASRRPAQRSGARNRTWEFRVQSAATVASAVTRNDERHRGLEPRLCLLGRQVPYRLGEYRMVLRRPCRDRTGDLRGEDPAR